VIAAGMVTVLLAFSPSPPPASVLNSKLLPYTISVSGIFAVLTPREIKDSFAATKDQVKADWSVQTPGKPAGVRRE